MYLSKKKIKGKEYTYLVHSVRLQDGKVKKIAKMLGAEESKNLNYLKKKYKGFFEERIRQLQMEESRKVDVKGIVRRLNGKRRRKARIRKKWKKFGRKKKGRVSVRKKSKAWGEDSVYEPEEVVLLHVLENETEWVDAFNGINLFLSEREKG